MGHYLYLRLNNSFTLEVDRLFKQFTMAKEQKRRGQLARGLRRALSTAQWTLMTVTPRRPAPGIEQ